MRTHFQQLERAKQRGRLARQRLHNGDRNGAKKAIIKAIRHLTSAILIIEKI
jgi:Tfp pilus assembly protein PilF